MSVTRSPPTHTTVPKPPKLVSPAQIASPSFGNLHDPSASLPLTAQVQTTPLSWSAQPASSNTNHNDLSLKNSLTAQSHLTTQSWSEQCKTPTLSTATTMNKHFLNASLPPYHQHITAGTTTTFTTNTVTTTSTQMPIMTTSQNTFCKDKENLPTYNSLSLIKTTTANVCIVCGNNCNNLCKLNINTINTVNYNNDQTSKGAIPKQIRPIISTPKTSVQTGLDRYITVVKRKRSPKSGKIASSSKLLKDDIAPNTQNRFSILDEESSDEPAKGKPSKPPPIYLREQNSNELVKSLVELIGENSFYVIPIKQGKIVETKIQVLHEDSFRKVVSSFEKQSKKFYTYQLKSSKGLQVVIKGIDSFVDPLELKSELENKGFKIKAVVNIRNRENIPQPLFRVELEPGDLKLKKNEVHPIYNLRTVLYRKITVEQPHKRTAPTQCLNCQEFGHTRTYCKLTPVCVVCGELHNTSKCDKARTDQTSKKCSNCGNNHTANYRGCPVYSAIYSDIKRKKHVPPVPKTYYTQSYANTASSQNPPHGKSYTQNAQSYGNFQTYANVVRPQSQHFAGSNLQRNPPNEYANVVQPQSQSAGSNPQCNPPNENLSKLEMTLDALVQTINNFTNSMNSMMQEMMRMQSMLLQALLNKP